MLSDEQYNQELNQQFDSYRSLNCFVMKHTYWKCMNDEELVKNIESTREKQYIVFEKDSLNVNKDGPTTNIVLSHKRTFEAAKAYANLNKKIAVLNFADNHVIGGYPYSSGAQEESLCRVSTLLPCLEKERVPFYEYHQNLFHEGKLTKWGNDDLIYSPGVVVFKTDESAPRMNEKKDWFSVDVITCAAPELQFDRFEMEDSLWEEKGGLKRLRKVFEVAKKEGVQVLILGAWGCGAFANPPTAVAKAFKVLCEEYHFETIEFAVFDRSNPSRNYEAFRKQFERR